MSYQYLTSYSIAKGINQRWQQVDLSTTSVNTLFNDYLVVYLQLKETVTGLEGYLNLEHFANQYKTYAGSLNALLVELGDTTLPLVEEKPDVTRMRHARYFDCMRHRFKVNLGLRGIPDIEQYRKADLIDLTVTKPIPGTHLSKLHTHGIPVVNGFLHRTDFAPSENVTYILDGGKTNYVSNMNMVGFIDFRDIGAVEKISITDEMISAGSASSLYKQLYLNLTGKSTNLENKTILLSLGGYLVLPKSEIFRRVDDDSVELCIQNMPYLERLMESRKYLDMSSLGLYDLNFYSEDAVNSAQATSDDVIRKYLKLSQSFLIVVDIQRMAFEKQFVRYANMPGIFTSAVEPVYPLVINYGKLGCYWKQEEDDVWEITVEDSYMRRYVLSENPPVIPRVYTGQEVPFRDNYYSSGYLLNMIGYNVV